MGEENSAYDGVELERESELRVKGRAASDTEAAQQLFAD